MKRHRPRVAGRKPSTGTVKRVPTRSKWSTLARRPVAWLAAAVLAAVAGVVAAAVTPYVNELVDAIMPGDDIGVVTDVVHLDDQGYSMAMPGAYVPTREQQALMNGLDADKAEALTRQLRAAGGADISALSFRILLEGRRNEAVRIVDIYPVNIKREKPFGGMLFDMPPQAGVPNMRMIFNMDEKFPYAYEAVADKSDGQLVPGELFFGKNTIFLPSREQEAVIVRATTQQNAVSFDLKIKYVIGDERRETTINDGGRRFQVTAPRCLTTNGLQYSAAYGFADTFSLVPVASSHQPSFC